MAPDIKFFYPPFPKDNHEYIRIAAIDAGSEGDDISVTLQLERFDRDHPPSYQALSYVWGSELHNSTSIKVKSSQLPGLQGYLLVRENLLSALRHVRLPHHPRRMWIDAICIDQDDEASKGSQVAMMDAIYSKANSVLVWLGPEADGSRRAMHVIRDLSFGIEVDWDTFAVFPRKGSAGETNGSSNPAQSCNANEITELHHLFNRPYFDRLWVRQEIMLADQDNATVQCGSQTVPWLIFRSSWLFLTRPRQAAFHIAREFRQRLDFIKGFLFQYPQRSLITHREDFGRAICHDSRDRIYAIRGMLDRRLQELILPDYSKSKLEVYRDATIKYLGLDQDLEILRQCILLRHWQAPSWIPDFEYVTNFPEPLDICMASGMLKLPWKLLDNNRVLRVFGVFIGSIECVDPLIPVEKQSLESIPVIVRGLLSRGGYNQREKYVGGGSRFDAFVRTLCNDVFRDNHDTPTNYVFPWYTDVQKYCRWLQRGVEKESKTAYNAGAVDDIIDRMRYTWGGRVFLRTTNRLVGLGPHIAEIGDEVYTIFGTRLLLLLRPDGGGSYRLVGECYISGYSHGEAVLGPLPEHIRPLWTTVDCGGYAEVFENTVTGQRDRVDPRLRDLGVKLDEYEESLKSQKRPWISMEVKELSALLEQKGIGVEISPLDII